MNGFAGQVGRFVLVVLFAFSGCTPRDFSDRQESADRAELPVRSPASPDSRASAGVRASARSLDLAAAPQITFLSFNGKHFGRPGQDLATIARLLAPVAADLIALQEVNTGMSGSTAIRRLAEGLATAGAGSYCTAFSSVPSDARERYAMLWKEESLSYVTTQGEAIDGCPESAVTLALFHAAQDAVIREPAYGTFQQVQSGKKFIVSTVHLVPSGKGPQHEVEPVFAALPGPGDAGSRLPLVILGDFNLSAAHPVFAAARSRGFSSALPSGLKTSLKRKRREYSKEYDLVFTRGMRCEGGARIDVLALLPEWNAERLSAAISDHVPVHVSCILN